MRAFSMCNGQTARPLARLLLASTMLAGGASIALATPAFAADEAEASTGLDEVIVTAQKREENLQDVPVSVQALGTEKLENLQVADFADYAKLFPSVAFRSTQPGFAQVYMRGVASGDNANHSGSSPSVGVYLDEQPITTIEGALDVHVYDIARIEALAGPQGTLYGASSQAGTLRIITNKPSTTGFAAGYDLSVNGVAHGEMGYSAEGFVNLPVNDDIAIRLVGWAERDGGFIDNVRAPDRTFTNGITLSNANRLAEDYNGVNTVGGRAAIKFDINENWTVLGQVMGQKQKSHGVFAFNESLGDLNVGAFYPQSSSDRWYQAALTVNGSISNFDLVYAGSYLGRHVTSEADYSDYSYFYDQANVVAGFYYDNLFNPINPSQYIQANEVYQRASHEFRVSSPKDYRFRVVLGAFYQRTHNVIEQRYKIDNLNDGLEVGGWSDTLWLTRQVRTDVDEAVFGEAEFDLIPEKLTLTGGVRFFHSEMGLKGFFGFGSGFSGSTGEAACFGVPVVPNTPCTNVNKTVGQSDHTYKVNLTWHIDDDKMVYGTISTGYRPGGVNRNVLLPPYAADFLKNYELGWKTTWADNTLRWNGAVFQEDWDDFQYSFLGLFGLTQIQNAGQARVRGVETDISWRPTDGLTISGSAAYTDAKTTSAVLAPSGTELPITSKFKGNAVVRYEWPWGEMTGHVQGAFAYQSSAWADLRLAQRAAFGKMDAFGTIDLTAGIEMDNWSAEIFVLNALDERGALNRYAECDPTLCTTIYTVPNKPMTVGLKFGQKF